MMCTFVALRDPVRSTVCMCALDYFLIRVGRFVDVDAEGGLPQVGGCLIRVNEHDELDWVVVGRWSPGC